MIDVLTFEPRRSVYWRLVFKARSTRIGVTVCAVGAMLALSMLPAEHLHASDFGKAFVHRHVIDDRADHPGSSLNHGDHTSVKTLDPTFDAQRHYDVAQPLLTAELLVATPDRRFTGRVDRAQGPPTHGPPIRIRSLRAPPA